MKKEKKQKHYAWTIVIACIMVYFTTSVTQVSLGNFVTPVVADFGITVQKMMLVSSIQCAVMAVLYPVAGKVLSTKKLQVVVSVALIAMLAGMFLMGFYPSITGFYISAVMMGAGSAFTQFLAMPLIINMWFKKKTGTALGICVSCGTAFGIFFNLLSAQLIEQLGWRMAYRILPIIPLIVAIPYIAIHLKSPEDVGCEPYGAGDAEEIGQADQDEKNWGVTRAEAFRMPMLYLAWACCLCYSVGSSVPSFTATFATMELGKSVAFGSVAVTCYSVGSVICGYLLGKVNDRFGVRAGMLWGLCFMTLSMIGMIFSIKNSTFLLPSCFFMGFGGLNMYSVQAPLVARTVMGDKHYSEIWSILMIGNSMIAALLISPLGGIFDKTGSFTIVFLIGIATFAAALVVGSIALKMSENYRKKQSL